jgi:UDP-N-acetylglucosamine--N-acetylmuramyl-(pentapeptide) pyrophosphoryl-undecaprenol N-acetylglucosamine transferase
MTSDTIILVAGGTGGHLYPAEALAQELLNRGHKVIIITDKRGGAFAPKHISAAERGAFKSLGDKVQILCVRAATFKPGLVSKIKAVRDILLGIVQSAIILKKLKPAVIVGFGGYPSYPTMFAGQRMGFATLLHEQNAVLGKANIHLADRAIAIAASLAGTHGIKPANEGKVTVTGNPVRAAICAVRDNPYPALTSAFEIFITGGSTALTHVFNETVPEALRLLPEEFRQRVHIIHQCRDLEREATAERYRNAGITAEIKSFFDDMPQRLAACHLFIGRSGASTVAELAVVGRPAIFVPYPSHADMQQKYNAEALTLNGGGWLMMQDQFTPQALAEQLSHFLQNPAILENAAQAAKACGQPEAVKKLADLVEMKLRI